MSTATNGHGKGDWARRRQVSRELYDLRWALAFGKIRFEDYTKKYHQLKKKGLA